MFHSAGAATAKPRLPMCFLGWVEEIDSLLPRVRLLDLIKAERYGVCERLIALNTKRLYLKRMQNWEPVEFFRKGCNMTHFVKSEDDAAKSILDPL